MATEQFRRKKVLIGKNKVWSYIRQYYNYKLDKMNYSLVIGEGTFYEIRNVNPKENLLNELSNKRESILNKMNDDVKKWCIFR